MTQAPAKRPPIAGYAVLTLGLASVVLGLAWKHIVPDSAFWSEQQATEYTEAYRAAHAASSDHDHSHDGSHNGSHRGGESHADETSEGDSLAAARERFDQAHAQLEQARDARNYYGLMIAVAGAILACAGLSMLRMAGEK